MNTVRRRRRQMADTPSGAKLREGTGNESYSKSDNDVQLHISPRLLEAPSNLKKNEVAGDSNADVERLASGPAGRGRVGANIIRPRPQLIASGQKRGRKPKLVTEIEGYGIFNRAASHLITEFFTRKTDAIHHLEQDLKLPWAQIKHQGKFLPVKVRITIDKEDLIKFGILKEQTQTE